MALLSGEQINQELKKLAGWELKDNAIVKLYTCSSFRNTIFFVNGIAALAESMDHHPDILIHGYKRVTITLTTHAEKGVTEKDITQAGRIEELYRALKKLGI